MKALTCGYQYGRECTCFCHAFTNERSCGCWRQVKTAEIRAVEIAQRREVVKADVGRDGRPLPEAALEGYLKRKVQAMGGIVFKITPVVKGLPDRCVMIPFGRVYFIEMKTSVGKRSPAQIVWHDRARKIGHVVHVINTKAKIDGFIRYAIATGAGLRDGHRQAQHDLDAMLNEYPYTEHQED